MKKKKQNNVTKCVLVVVEDQVSILIESERESPICNSESSEEWDGYRLPSAVTKFGQRPASAAFLGPIPYLQERTQVAACSCSSRSHKSAAAR